MIIIINNTQIAKKEEQLENLIYTDQDQQDSLTDKIIIIISQTKSKQQEQEEINLEE